MGVLCVALDSRVQIACRILELGPGPGEGVLVSILRHITDRLASVVEHFEVEDEDGQDGNCSGLGVHDYQNHHV